MHLFLQFAKQSLQLCSVTVLLLILAFPLQGMAQTVFTKGTGTIDDPYQITTEAQLKEISGNRDEKHYILMDDISLINVWKPIDSFAGSLNGNGFKITNLTIVDDDAGLFKTNEGIISNLGVEVASIQGKYTAGTIAARNDGEISNCFVTGGTISVAEKGTVGGIAGLNNNTISNCYVALKRVQITVPTPDGAAISLGGIAGNMVGADASVKYCLVANEEMSVEGATGPKYANNIVGGSYAEEEFSADNKLNFFSYKVLRTGVFQNMTNPLTPLGMTGQLWLGSFPTNVACKWAKNKAGEFCLKGPGGKEMVAINPSDHLYLDGEGTTDSPYLIKNEADLIKLRDYVNKGGNSEVGFCYKLANDITMSDTPFLPIGKYREGYNVGFFGIFEGGGHRIEKLKLDNTGISEVGLFGCIGWRATIRNLAVTNCSITITHTGDGGLLLAPIVGDATNAWEATIENCYTTGTIDVTSDASDPLAGSVSVGGIAGACNCAITNCYSEVNIIVDVKGESRISGIGGITGLTSDDGRVTNCLAKGSIEAKAEAGGELRCGGIVGEYATIPTQTCLALNPSIKATTSTTTPSYVSQIALKNDGQAFDPTTVNYASQKMKLFKNDTRYMPVPDTEEAGVGIFVEVDGSPWQGKLPSDDGTWQTIDGHVNLKSIAETFHLTQQVKVSEHLPLTITIPKIANGTLTSDSTKAFFGDKVTLTITPDPGCKLIESSLKYNDTLIVAVNDVYSFIMPSEAVTLSATFVPDTLRLKDISGDSLLISQKADLSWWYEVKTTEAATKALRQGDGKTLFNGIITGTLADGTLVMGATCQSEITFTDVIVPTFIIEQGAAVVLSGESKLTYTEAQNKGGSLVAKSGAIITAGTGTTIKTSAITIATPTNGTLTVVVGTTTLASGDQVTEDSKFTVTATPAPGYETASVQVMQGTTELIATGGVYTMPGEAITVSATFEVGTLNLGDIPATGNSVLISQKAEDKTWWYEVKAVDTGTKALRLADGKTPFNGIITGTLAAGKALVMGATCQSEITFTGVTVPTLIIEEGAAIVLSSASKLTYTTAQNNGGSLVAKSGATITDGADGTIKTRAVTITAPTNGTFTVQVGTTTLASGDKVTEGSRFTVTATPSPGYETVSVKVMQGTVELTATDGVYTMPGEAITVSATFEVGTLNLGDIPATGNSVLISQKAEDKTWWYEVTETGTKALRLGDGKTPFNGIITGTLAAGKALVMGATCQSEITFTGVTVPTLIIEEGAAVVLSKESRLTYTTAQNNGGSLVAKSGATITDGADGTIKTRAVTITEPANGTFTVQVGTTLLTSGDMVTEGSRFTVTATPAPGYETTSVQVMQGTTELTATDGAYTMPGTAITVSATFEVSALNLGDIPATGNSVLISQKAEDKTWWYEVKTTEAGTKALRLADGKTPFNGIITGTLAAGKALVMGATCQSEITFNGVTVSTLIIEEGAAIVLSSASRLTYTTAQNNGGSLVAKNGATLTDGADGTIKTRAVTITAPTNGIFTVQVGTTLLASGDMVTEGSRFTVTATPAPDYETVSVKVMQGTTELTATDGVYTMPGEAITVSATFRRIEVTPPTGYYIVTLPAITGAATNPIAGSYEVEEGGNFSFGLILDADYNQSVPLVEVNGIALTPGDSDGKYLVENIQDNSTVSITGIVKNTPTDNVKVESANRIYALNGILYIQTSQPVEAYIVSLGGQLLRSLHLPAGETKVGGLSRGLYIVRLSNGTSQKVKL